MSRWFRHYAGMMRDPKLVGVAARTKQSIERVAFVWGCILEDAAEARGHGSYTLDIEEVAYFLRCSSDEIAAIHIALAAAGLVTESNGSVTGGVVIKWGERQYETSVDDPTNAIRQRRYREKRKQNQGESNGVTQTLRVTVAKRPETETETDIEEPIGSSSAKRGSRIPDDWMPDEVFAAGEGLSAQECQREAQKFRDYWRGLSGQKGVKADWAATWRNWVRKYAEGRKQTPAVSTDWRQLPEYRGCI